jgi:hypothetical protein
MFFGQDKVMTSLEREKRSRRMFYALILGLIVAYGGIKYRHIVMALDAYQDQPLNADTSRAAK